MAKQRKVVGYVISVEVLHDVTATRPREWVILNKDPDGNETRGYAPEIVETRRVTEQIYAQTVANLDMSALVSVVNKISS